MSFTVQELEQDVEFLAARAEKAGSFSLNDPERETGVSSNSLVSFAYGGSYVINPSDSSDLQACTRAYDKLPAHRKTEAVKDAFAEQTASLMRKRKEAA